MADTMIERIARHLCAKEGGDPDEIRQGEGKAAGQSWTGWQAYASEAEGILTVMREPTNQAICVGGAALQKGLRTEGTHVNGMSRNTWRAMIDAALAGD